MEPQARSAPTNSGCALLQRRECGQREQLHSAHCSSATLLLPQPLLLILAALPSYHRDIVPWHPIPIMLLPTPTDDELLRLYPSKSKSSTKLRLLASFYHFDSSAARFLPSLQHGVEAKVQLLDECTGLDAIIAADTAIDDEYGR